MPQGTPTVSVGRMTCPVCNGRGHSSRGTNCPRCSGGGVIIGTASEIAAQAQRMLTRPNLSERHSSDDGLHVTRDVRVWDTGNPARTLFILLSPETAEDNPTIAAAVKSAKSWGQGGCEFVYLLTRVDFMAAPEPIFPLWGDDDGEDILDAADECPSVVAAWGNIADEYLLTRAQAVTDMLARVGKQLACMGVNENGTPKNPAYARPGVARVPYPAGVEHVATLPERPRPRGRRRARPVADALTVDAAEPEPAGRRYVVIQENVSVYEMAEIRREPEIRVDGSQDFRPTADGATRTVHMSAASPQAFAGLGGRGIIRNRPEFHGEPAGLSRILNPGEVEILRGGNFHIQPDAPAVTG